MTIPAAIRQLLSDQQVEFEVSSRNMGVMSVVNNQSENVARLAILQDPIGRVQVIYPGNTLLDLNELQERTNRQFSPPSQQEIQSILNKLSLEDLPALPQLTGLETFVDRRLMESTQLQMEVGDEVINLSQQDFQRLTQEAQLFDFAIPLPQPTKPDSNWQKLDLRSINNAVTSFTTKRIKQRLEETLDMPPLPETAQKIIALRVDPNADTVTLANLVETDPGLAAQVVSWAASPYYAAPGTIKSVEDAVVRVLGFDLVINLALGLSLGRSLTVPKNGPAGYTPFWQQSVYVAAAMGELVPLVSPANRPGRGMAYLSGLLHNFGYLILSQVFPPHFEMINRHIEVNPTVSRQLIEQHLLEINREQIASALMSQWSMPEEVVIAQRYQNEPTYDGEHASYAKLLYICTRLLRQQGIGDAPTESIPDEVFESLNLDREEAEQRIQQVIESSNELIDMANKFAG